MPITQERFISVLNAGEAMLEVFKEIRIATKGDGAIIVAEANAFVERTEDITAVRIVNSLLSIINRLQGIIIDTDMIAGEMTATMVAERKHFLKRAKANHKAALYQEHLRRQQGIVPRNIIEPLRAAQPPTVQNFKPQLIQAAGEPQRKIAEDDPGLLALQAELNKRTEKTQTQPRTIDREAERLEIERILQEQQGETEKQAKPAPEPTLSPNAPKVSTLNIPVQAGLSYDKDVLSTSVPSLDELNSQGTTKPGESVL